MKRDSKTTRAKPLADSDNEELHSLINSLLPILRRRGRYDHRWLRPDVLAGFSDSAFHLVQDMDLRIQSGPDSAIQDEIAAWRDGKATIADHPF